MSRLHSVVVIAGAHLGGNPRQIGVDERTVPLAKLPTAYVVALSLVMLCGIVGAAWWVWLVSRDLTAVYARGLLQRRSAGGVRRAVSAP